MTVTDTPPETTGPASAAEAPSRPVPAAPGGLAGVLGSGDHKVIGRLYIAFSLVFVLASGVAGQLAAVDKIDGTTGNTVLSADTFFQVFSFHSTSGVFLFLLPLLVGLAFVVVPLQVGADAIAFPRAAAASFWAWLIGGGLYVASFAINGGPGGGSTDGVSLWLASFVVVIAALLLACICLVTTVFALRAPGMYLDRVPFFAWSILVSGVLWILSLSVLIATITFMWVDFRYGKQSLGAPGVEMYGRMLWALRQPQIYAFAVPALGFSADVVATAARARQGARSLAYACIGAFAVLGFGAFIQTALFAEAVQEPVYNAMAVLAVLPVLVLLGLFTSTVRAGRPRLISPLLFAVSSMLMLLVAVLVGATASVQRFDLQGTLFEGAQVHYTVLAAAIAGLGGLWYWATKINGRPLSEGLGRIAALALLLGTIGLALPDALSGAFGDGDETVKGLEGLNVVSAAGGLLVIGGVLLCILGLLGGLRRKGDSPKDPWEGQTLEWATDSPPSLGNFAEMPTVHSAEPLLDSTETKEAEA